jgi:hypothetical protein
MRIGNSLGTLLLLVLPTAAFAQGGYGEPGDQSIIRQTGFGWRNQVVVPDGHCGCSVPVRTDCYNQPCCFRCGLRPLCFLQRVHRMLDCLLPCRRCCCLPGGGLLGGRCGGCCAPACCSPGCSCSSSLPGFSDPFIDDPLPPKPIADPGTEVRYRPAMNTPGTYVPNSPTATSARPSPYKVTRPVQRTSRSATGLSVVEIPATPKPKLARPPAEQSVLRRASAEEPGRLPSPDQTARPIVRSQSPEDATDYAIPHNPLRSR